MKEVGASGVTQRNGLAIGFLSDIAVITQITSAVAVSHKEKLRGIADHIQFGIPHLLRLAAGNESMTDGDGIEKEFITADKSLRRKSCKFIKR